MLSRHREAQKLLFICSLNILNTSMLLTHKYTLIKTRTWRSTISWNLDLDQAINKYLHANERFKTCTMRAGLLWPSANVATVILNCKVTKRKQKFMTWRNNAKVIFCLNLLAFWGSYRHRINSSALCVASWRMRNF